jgi:hypothetical protein
LSTFLLLHGASSSGWFWHLVEPLLESAGHEAVAPDLPADDPSAGLAEYVATAIDALDAADREDVIVVAQSMAGFFAPVIAEERSLAGIVLLAAMIPDPGERGHDWWVNTGQPDAQRQRFDELGLDVADANDPEVIYAHDVPHDLWAQAGRRVRDQTGRPFDDPCPIPAWPPVPTHIVVPGDDRLLPIEFQRRLAKERLGLDFQTIPGGHLAALSQPRAVADALLQAVR